ncbi:MAG TPA: hypothetical protein VNJ03_17075 [Vicinamibacterales bacterium]|nr:hypothetical protein [Vicinamibacterales bacterium]
MNDPNLGMLERAVTLLAPLLEELVFVGGCATGLLISDPASGGIRPTKDVDTIVEVSSYAQYAQLSERLRSLKLHEDTREDAPTCRWRKEDLTIDIMPTDERILGFSNRWYKPAIQSADSFTVGEHVIRLINPVYFVATKLEAFHGRGKGDVTASHDLEDVVTVIDGRLEIIDEIHFAPEEVRMYIAEQFRALLNDTDFADSLPGFLFPDDASQARAPLLRTRLQRAAKSAG